MATIELKPMRIWRDPKNKLWKAGLDRSMVAGMHPTAADAFKSVRDVCEENGYSRFVVIERRSGKRSILRVGGET